MPIQRMMSRAHRGAQLLQLIRPRVAHPLRGLRADLAALTRKVEADLESLCAIAAAQETAGRELEVRLNALKMDVADVARGGESSK